MTSKPRYIISAIAQPNCILPNASLTNCALQHFIEELCDFFREGLK
ncbi:hypothetical protein KPSA3_07479 [Pseudomonas syringae pv. actinidiae]|uniref:Uncharacterized protein n=1 Tax=Pseudomonas syringae pv. actinidiae TaxID=103796 RepID=A0AAN4QCF0_PSESF|nr:hypothetical protein KPSA3_07479 [Pseudomonas syringae pv. actinidiae]